MKNVKMYEADDKMINVIRDNYNILQSLSAFGISMGFGDKTIRQVCEEQGVDTYTFMAVVNFTINGYKSNDTTNRLSAKTLLRYLQASHTYFLDFQLPFIRRELTEALDQNDSVAKLIIQLYDEYEHSIRLHMKYEEKTVFPYVEGLLMGNLNPNYDIHTFSKHHTQVDSKLKELKNILIQYLPADGLRNNMLMATLYDIYNCQEWLEHHANVEDELFIPTIHKMEKQCQQNDVSSRISSMINSSSDNREVLSEREKDVVICAVQGMSNKEIADHLCISTNTAITHRRNIAKKLQIHTLAGLTIYAIVNNLIDISSIES